MMWSDYFLCIAFLVAQKSKDAQTKHGCLLVDEFNRIIGCGYNSFARGMPDDELPTERPAKYPLILHAEKNALLNCTVDLRRAGATAYITGHPCFSCAYDLWQAGIEKVVYAERKDWEWHASEEEAERFEILKRKMSILPNCGTNFDHLIKVVGIAQKNNWLTVPF